MQLKVPSCASGILPWQPVATTTLQIKKTVQYTQLLMLSALLPNKTLQGKSVPVKGMVSLLLLLVLLLMAVPVKVIVGDQKTQFGMSK